MTRQWLSQPAHMQIPKHILYLISVVVTFGIYEGFYANRVWWHNPHLGEIHCSGKKVHWVQTSIA